MLKGFKDLVEDSSFVMSSYQGILCDDSDDESDLVKERYKLFQRKQKLERIVNDK